MCNAKKMNATLPCPASEALERAAKRPRLGPSNETPSFDFVSLFDAVTGDAEEAFPSIGWDFEDEETSLENPAKEVIAMPSALGKKRDRTGLVRSKAIETGLFSLSVSTPMSTKNKSVHSPLLLEKIAADALKISNKFDQIHCSKESHLLQMARKSVFPTSLKADADLHHQRSLSTLV